MRRLTFASLMLLSLSAAAFDLSLIKTPSAADDAKAKQFEADPTVARVYAFRDSSFLGKSVKSHFVIAGRIAATTGGGEFAVISLAPGSYDVECLSAGSGNALATLTHNRRKTTAPLVVEAGKLYFLQEAFKGAKGFELKTAAPAEAEPIIKKGRLAAQVDWK